MSWSAVIPSASASNLIHAVERIQRTHPGLEPQRIVVVDDGARAGAEPRLPRAVRWLEGPKPFVFSRNVNLGIAACEGDHVIVMGDDVEVMTPQGFDVMEAVLRANPALGIVSPGIVGAVGNPNQRFDPWTAFRSEPDMLAFICVMIPRRVWEAVGPMDERFTGYGFDDVDYCWRIREAGFHLGVTHRCVVRHDGTLPSVYRNREDFRRINDLNQGLLAEKWGRA